MLEMTCWAFGMLLIVLFAVTVPSTKIALYNVTDDVKTEESKVTTLTERAD